LYYKGVKNMNIKIYTDGACSGNPGPGGYGCILSTVLNNGQLYEVKHSGGCRMTTNNRMEMIAVIQGLLALNGYGHNIEVITDSKYVCDAFNEGWVYKWHAKGWQKKGGLANRDLWSTLFNLVTMQNSVKFTWIRGHNGHPYNEECDRIAVCARQDTAHLETDTGYERFGKI